jgi:hypothetical protein
LVGSSVSASVHYHYGNPEALSIPQFILYGQMQQALYHAAVVEATRFRKGDPQDDCDRVPFFWSYNDTWGETCWSIIDHYGRRKASYYWFKRNAAPMKVFVRPRDGHLATWIVNDTLNGHRAVVRCG